MKTSKLKLQEAIKQNEEEIQICAWELYALVDSVSKYKEHMASKISEMKSNLSETAGAVSDSYKGSLPAQFGIALDASHWLKLHSPWIIPFCDSFFSFSSSFRVMDWFQLYVYLS